MRQPRLAHQAPKGPAGMRAVTFEIDGELIVIGGMDIKRTLKHRNVLATGKAAFVVDVLVTTRPWRPRGVKVHGRAEVIEDGDKPSIRITPTTIWSWGINHGAQKHFGGIIDKRGR